MPKKWTPGPQRPAREKLDERFAWADNYEGECVIFVQDPTTLFNEDGSPKTTYLTFGSGDNVHLTVNPKRSRNSSTLMLTNLTERELDELKQLFDLAFEWAKPVVQLRDREAREALETSGDDVNPRNYRQVPQLVVRRRPVGEYGEGVRVGPETVPGVGSPAAGSTASDGDAADREAGRGVKEVAWDSEAGGVPEDDEATYYESTEFGDLGTGAAGPRELQVPEPPSVEGPPNPRPPRVPTPPIVPGKVMP